ncbi:MAG: DUF4349 domain-containing protein [Haloarculaceae archaeon]
MVLDSVRSRTRYAGLAVVVLVVLAGCTGGGGGGFTGNSQQTGASLAAGSDGGGGVGGAGGVGSYYTDDGQRVLIRESDMRLRVNNFSRALFRLRVVAHRHGGYVGDRSQRSEGQWDGGHVTIRVPAENFSAARDDVAAVGHLESENVRVLDFTAQYEDRQQRIEQLQGDERSLQRLLANTTDADQALQVRQELQQVRQQMRDLQRQQASLRQREAMSTIRIDLHEPDSRKPPDNFRASFGFTDAFLGAFYGGLTAVKYVIVFFGYAIPVGIALVLLGAFGSVLYLTWQRIFYGIRAVFDGTLGAVARNGGSNDGGDDSDGGESGGDSGEAGGDETVDDASDGGETVDD